MRKMLAASLALAVAPGGCGTDRDSWPDGAHAELSEPSGRLVANAAAYDEDGGLRIHVDAAGLAPGVYGVHIHSVGRCDPPGFESAGPHWNPAAREHGARNPRGPHLGDLPNLSIGADGRGRLIFTIPGVGEAIGPHAMMDGDGAAIIIHAQADDYRTDPSGNSGARLACGVFRRMRGHLT